MTTRSDKAVAKFLSGYNCAQSVIWAFANELGLDQEHALKIACGFGAGMARKQEVCGALTGGIMALGLRYGRGEGQDRTATELTYAKVQELMRRFEEKHKTCICRQLLHGCDLSTEDGRKVFREELHDNVCKQCVKTATEIVETLMTGN